MLIADGLGAHGFTVLTAANTRGMDRILAAQRVDLMILELLNPLLVLLSPLAAAARFHAGGNPRGVGNGSSVSSVRRTSVRRIGRSRRFCNRYCCVGPAGR